MTNWRKRPRFARLLPGVVVVGAGLLVLNASGLIHDAQAGIDTTVANDAMAPPPPPKDLSGDVTQTASAAEVDVLTSLAKRRSELDAREAQIQTETTILTATETRVDAKIAQLKSLQTQIAALLAQRDAAQEKQVAALVKTYSAMKAKDAARIFDSLNDEVLLAVAEEMKSDTLAPVLAAMNPDAGSKAYCQAGQQAGAAGDQRCHDAAAFCPCASDAGSPRRGLCPGSGSGQGHGSTGNPSARPRRLQKPAVKLLVQGLPRVNAAAR